VLSEAKVYELGVTLSRRRRGTDDTGGGDAYFWLEDGGGGVGAVGLLWLVDVGLGVDDLRGVAGTKVGNFGAGRCKCSCST